MRDDTRRADLEAFVRDAEVWLQEHDGLRPQIIPNSERKAGTPWWLSIRYRQCPEAKLRALLADRDAKLAAVRKIQQALDRNGNDAEIEFSDQARDIVRGVARERAEALQAVSRG